MKDRLLQRAQRILKAFYYSFNGLKVAGRQAPFQEELIACAVLIPLALYLDFSWVEKILLISSLILILILEIVNTAIEMIVDRIGTEHNELSGMAKDLGSAAVFVGIVWAAIIWIWALCK